MSSSCFAAPRLPHVAVLALISIGFAGCSADMSTRLSQESFPIPLPHNRKPPASVPPPRSSAANCRNMPVRNRWANPRPPADRSTAVLSDRQRQLLGRRARVTSYAPPGQPLRPPAAPRRARSRRTTDRDMAAPRSSSARAIRSIPCRAAITFRPPRSCRPTVTRDRAPCRRASN